MKINFIILQISLLVTSSIGEWIEKRDTRLPLELRVANEGLAHDDNHWYLTNKHFLYQTTVSPITITNTNYQAIPNGIIYGGLEAKEGNGALATWDTKTLEMQSYKITDQKDMPWVAIDPDTMLLWSLPWGECCAFNIWNSTTLELHDTFKMPDGVELPKEIQGGAFYKGDLYLSSNINDAVWKMVRSTAELSMEVSDIYRNHEYEMEGLDFWDLREIGLGTMHMYGNFMQLKEKAIHHYDDV